VAGSLGRFATFSFHGSKTVSTGEGGMLVTDDDDLFAKVQTLANHGRAPGETRQFWPSVIGFKYRMSNIQAAIGCGQLQRIDELVAGKRRIFRHYQSRLAGLPLAMNPEPPGTVNGYWMPTIIVNEGVPFSRDDLLAAFAKANIDGRIFFWPLSMTPPFSRPSSSENSQSLYRRGVNLPSYHDLTEAEMDRVVDVVTKFIPA
jgi:perosamine synthetase